MGYRVYSVIAALAVCAASPAMARQVRECGIIYNVGYSYESCPKDIAYNGETVFGHPEGAGFNVDGDQSGSAVCSAHDETRDGFVYRYRPICIPFKNGFGTGFGSTTRPFTGIQNYSMRAAACRLPQFGIQGYNDCEILMTTPELDRFIAVNQTVIPALSRDLLILERDYRILQKDEESLGCMIEKYDGNPIYNEVADDLKAGFRQAFGKEYQPGAAKSCSDSASSLPADRCDASDRSQKCETLAAWHETFAQLLASRNQILSLKSDVVARQNDDYRNRLNQLISEVPEEVK